MNTKVATPNISLVLTFYNEEKILEQSIHKIDDFLSSTNLNVELIFIDDGSIDKSKNILNRLKEIVLKKYDCQFFMNSEKIGRGACVDMGFQMAKSDIVGYLDTDLDIPIYYLLPAYNEMMKNKWDALIGRRSFLFSFSKFIRIIMTQTYSFFVRKYLGFPYHQTEAGFKFFKKEKYLQLREHIIEKHWFWDTEVMVLCNLFKYKVYEMPITVIHQELRPTNVNFFQDTLDSLLTSVKIKERVKKIKFES
jgi:glycosyltransferase involved in cell wall biosynthesis